MPQFLRYSSNSLAAQLNRRIPIELGWLACGIGLTVILMGFWSLPQIPLALLILMGATAVLVLAMFAAPLKIYRRRRSAAVLGHLLSALQLKLPLPTYLRAAATGEPRAMRARLILFAGRLEAGMAIAPAIADAAAELPPLALDRLTAAEKNFTLEQTVVRLIEQEKNRAIYSDSAANGFTYFCVVAWCMTFVAALNLVYVAPKMEKILIDFRAPMPLLLRLLLRPEAETVVMIAMIVFSLLLLRTIAGVSRNVFTSIQIASLLRPLIDPIEWYAPIVGRVVRARSAAAVCEALSAAFAIGRPAPEAVMSANLPALNQVLQRRMRNWQERIATGQPIGSAARESRMPHLMSDLLASTPLDIAGSIAFAGRAYSATSERAVILIRAIMPILLTAIFAVAIALLALSMFQPMLSIINAASAKGLP